MTSVLQSVANQVLPSNEQPLALVSVKVEMRNKNHILQCANMGDLMKQCIDFLNKKPICEGFVLQPENIWIFRPNQSGTQNADRVEFAENDALEQDGKYYVYECFTKVPTDMFRTVEFKQTDVITYSNPAYIPGERLRFSKASPILCGAMSVDESKSQAFCVDKKENKLFPNGISLFSKDTAEKLESSVGPLRPIELDEMKGQISLSLGQYEELVTGQGGVLHPKLGILKTSVTHAPSVIDANLLGKPKNMTVKITDDVKNTPGRSGKCANNKRETQLRYVLAKDTDLEPFNMAIIYDDRGSEAHQHCTLIRTNFPATMDDECPSYSAWGAATESEIQEMLAPSPKRDLEPETFLVNIPKGGRPYLAFPKVAALFGIHDIMMRASAEPVPPEHFNPDSEQGVLYEAA